MLTLLAAIKERRSIRKYRSDAVSEELIEQMLEAARLAPSGGNRQPWRFIVVRDANERQAICRLRSRQPFVEEAPLLIVCFADLDQYRQPVGRQGGSVLADPPRERLVLSAVSNTFITIEHLLLMATALGLGTCWLGAIDDARLNQLFGLADNMISVAIITVGYPDGEIPPPRPRLSLEEIVLKPQVQLPREATLI